MKIVIDIPEKTNAHIRSDYGHGVKGLKIEDMEILVDAVYHGKPYEERPTCKFRSPRNCDFCAFCSDCEECWKEGQTE